jgi:ketol-acid reductoisomerase
VITDETRDEMRRMLAEIREGVYARNWTAENEAGRPWFNATRAREQEQRLEQVGAALRAMMPFLDPVTVRPDGQERATAPEPAVSR